MSKIYPQCTELRITNTVIQIESKQLIIITILYRSIPLSWSALERAMEGSGLFRYI